MEKERDEVWATKEEVNEHVAEQRRMQSFGRKELASPVAEALRKIKIQNFLDTDSTERCNDCLFFMQEDEDGNIINWCSQNETGTVEDNYCDEFEKEN